MNEDFTPSKTFSRLLHFWWALVFLMILGGVAGMLFSRFHHPVYESQATITSVLDYSVLGKLDDTEEDQVFVGIGEIIDSSSVKNALLDKARSEKIILSQDEILNSLSLDRQDNRWVLRVRLNDPSLAQQINTFWSDAAMQALESMKADAVTGFMAQQYIDSLVTCLQQSVVTEFSSSACNSQNVASIQSEIKKAIDDPEMKLSSGSLLFLHTSFELTGEPSLPSSPALFGQNISAFAGMLIALIVGLVLFSIDFPTRKKPEGVR